MLVVTANWGFADGTLVAGGVRPRATRAWLRDVRLAAIRSGFGRDGAYRPPAGLDIVLAGDTFDTFTSAAWCGRDRPWQRGARVRDARQRVLHGCTRRAVPLLAGLARLVRSGLAAPAADRRGRPATAAVVRVPVRVAVLVGDRDCDVAEAAVGSAARDATVAPAWSDGTVLVRHGHEFDPACHAEPAAVGDERAPTLAESVAIDLVAAFAATLATAAVPRRPVDALVAMLAAAGPADLPAVVGAWAAADGPAAALDGAARRDIAAAWRRAVEGWLQAARRAPPDCGMPASPLEALAGWFATAVAAPLPAVLAGVFDRRLPPAAAVGDGLPAVVLGHPPSSDGDAATICLGRSPLRRWGPVTVVREGLAAEVTCVAAVPDPAVPVTIACRRDGDRLEWRRLGAAGSADPEAGPGAAAVVDAA